MVEVLELSRDIGLLPPLNESNALIGDRAALDAAWERDGYWFFRDVLNGPALQAFQSEHLAQLAEYGVVDPGAQEPLFNGGEMKDLPKRLSAEYGQSGTMQGSPWKALVADPQIHAFFTTVLGHEPAWVPIAESRMLPPDRGELLDRNPFVFPHQDGFYNEGYLARTCWIPVFDSPRSVGGLAVAQGCHKSGYLHDLTQAPRYPIRPGAINEDAWRLSDYRVGDLIIFDYLLPHAGVRNRSGTHVRVSFDVRCVYAGETPPLIGAVVVAGVGAITVETEGGERVTVPTDADTYWRGTGRATSAVRLAPEDIALHYPPGQMAMIAVGDGRARSVRPPKY